MDDLRQFLWHKRLISKELRPWIGHYRSYNNKTFVISEYVSASFCVGYIIEGTGCLEQNGKSCNLKAGSILLRFPGIPQKQRYDKGYFSECYVALPKSLFQFLLDMNLISYDNVVIDFTLSDGIITEFDRLLEFCEKDSNDRLGLAYSQAFNFVFNLLYRVHSHSTVFLSKLEKAASILSNPKEYSLTIPMLAASLNLRTSTFRKMFYDHYHVPPAEFRIRKRLEQISAQLIQTDKTIKELVDEYGYPNVFVFSRQFKRFVGMTPTQYRKFYTQ